MTGGGKRDRRIIVERDSAGTENDFGEPVEGWAKLHNFMARVVYGKGEERRAAAIEGGSQAASFRVVRSARSRAVKVGDRISFDGALWDIESTPEYGRRELEFIATRRAA